MAEKLSDVYEIVTNWIKRSVPLQDVDDVAQEVMLSALTAIENKRTDCKLTTLLYPIVKRRIADYYRKDNKPIPDVEPAEEYFNYDPLSEAMSDETLGFILGSGIPYIYKEILYFHLWLGLGFVELEETRSMGTCITQEAYRSRYRRAIELLGNAPTGPGKVVDVSELGNLDYQVCALPDCSVVFVPSWLGRKRIYCSDPCSRKARRRKSESALFMERECELDECDVVFKPVRLQKYCCPNHRSLAYYRRKGRDTRRERRKMALVVKSS